MDRWMDRSMSRSIRPIRAARLLGWAALVLLAFAGCRTFDVRTDWDPGHGFDALQRFAFVEPPELEGANPFADNDLLRKRVRHALVSVLLERGHVEVDDPARADFLVTYAVLLEERLRVHEHAAGVGGGFYRRPFGLGTVHSTADIRSVQESTLLIDVLEPTEQALVWRGWGTGILGTRDRDRGDERLFDGVRAILREFPPGEATRR